MVCAMAVACVWVEQAIPLSHAQALARKPALAHTGTGTMNDPYKLPADGEPGPTDAGLRSRYSVEMAPEQPGTATLPTKMYPLL